MRLICPNCGAQYEVPEDVIPPEGRDVQCSACSTSWFQAHPSQDAFLADETEAPSIEPVSAPPEPSAPSLPERSLDPELTDVLREEAARERAAREAERSAPLESQPDLGLDEETLDETERRARQARERMARLRGEAVAPEVAVAATTATAGARRDLLPDIEQINSTLRASDDRTPPTSATDADLPKTAPKLHRKNRGFRRSFFGVILLAAAAIAAYVFGPQISAAIPAAEPYLAGYSAQVETARSSLSGYVDQGLAWLDQMAAENL